MFSHTVTVGTVSFGLRKDTILACLAVA